MILKIDGNINRYYAQTLCMVFFPGATFGENEEETEGIPQVHASVSVDESEHRAVAYVSIKLNDRVCEAEASAPLDDRWAIATPESIAFGKALFAAGKELIGVVPPWGILTGVRPAKIAGKLIKNGGGIIKSKRILRDDYLLHPQKAALAVSVAASEMRLLRKEPAGRCSLYISIPFCPTRCAYCSFVSYTTPRLLSLIDPYVDALCEDIVAMLDTMKELSLTLSTVYIGGGTPTTLTAEQLERIFLAISSRTDTAELLEFTVEAGRPDTITEEKLAVAKKYGVTRISVNPQTLSDDILKEIGRKHTVEDFYRAYQIAKDSGIRDINVDLIAGLPGDDFKNFSETMDKIIELDPSNITVHTFSVKKAADVLRNNSNVYSAAGGDAAKCVSYAQIKSKFAGYKPYYMYRQKNTVGNLENVGYAKEGREGLYNVYMMEEVQTIFAVGAGAVTKLVDNSEGPDNTKISRLFAPKYPYEYLKEKENGKCFALSMRQQILDFYKK